MREVTRLEKLKEEKQFLLENFICLDLGIWRKALDHYNAEIEKIETNKGSNPTYHLQDKEKGEKLDKTMH